MNHWIITVPGWGTVYGRGTKDQANEVARLRARPGITVVGALTPDQAIEWRSLTELLEEIR